MAFKKCTVASAKVAATLTNYPTYVDLDRVGVTTLAEAQSIRVYADESKTTEWAREIVSVDEMHVKIPSLTTTTTIYVDYDGVRSDYGVTDTYGRNAVWGDYIFVLHFENGFENSAGGSGVTTSNSGTTDVAGKLGRGRRSASTGHRVSFTGLSSAITDQNMTFSAWVKMNASTPSLSNHNHPVGLNFRASNDNHYPFTDNNAYINVFRKSSRIGPISLSGSIARNAWHKITVSNQSGTNGWKFYQNLDLRNQSTGDTFSGSDLDATHGSQVLNSDGGALRQMAGEGDEYRLAKFTQSADWITTEYNNQSDEATFWPTWEDVGGGAVAKKGFMAWL